jgi:hypothetical protein
MPQFDGPAQGVQSGGFIDIGEAERARQGSVVATFRGAHGAEYEQLVKAVIAVKLAHQSLEHAKAACKSVPLGTTLSDLLDAAEREARIKLSQAADEATAAQLEQIGNVATNRPAKRASS